MKSVLIVLLLQAVVKGYLNSIGLCYNVTCETLTGDLCALASSTDLVL